MSLRRQELAKTSCNTMEFTKADDLASAGLDQIRQDLTMLMLDRMSTYKTQIFAKIDEELKRRRKKDRNFLRKIMDLKKYIRKRPKKLGEDKITLISN